MSHRAIVTGGSRGIGFAIARAILRGGGRVMITGRDDQRLNDAVQSLGKLVRDASRAAGTVVDVRDRGGIERLVDDTARRFGGIDTLVNNAGVGVFADVAKMTDDEWADVIDTNLTGVFYCSRAAIPELRKAGGAWIINIASLAGRNYFPRGAAYCASKAGLIAFSEALMQEVRYDDIRVTRDHARLGRDRVQRPVGSRRRRRLEAVQRRRRGVRDGSAAPPAAQPAEPRRDPPVEAAQEVSVPNPGTIEHGGHGANGGIGGDRLRRRA